MSGPIGVLVKGDCLILVLDDVRVKLNAEGARALSTLLLTGADMAEVGASCDDEDEDTLRVHKRGNA